MLIDKLSLELKQAMLARDEVKVGTLRLLLSELNYARIQKGGELADSDVVAVVQKEVKKRKEAAEGFRSGGREELAQKEEAEAAVLKDYLPAQLSDEELEAIIDEAIAKTGASGITDMGKVIGMVMGKAAGAAEGGRVSAKVKEKLLK